ncbi:hypothetical protein SAMN04488102_101377 [Alkalibacterium subtropicum]|uniref:Uncharacterized protein n=1 Tax=Alkalibacterium subtropicum TaxID=753702 RepID=A0A1I1EWM5_9LACT|nr:hypothetical protein [Alkalibacterium subtropicum]SFB91116.1 hypothetical protein SAMN04488102_101377 [Alkalibacterium subtropicum]
MENIFNDYNTSTIVHVHKVENKDEYYKVAPVEDVIKQYPFFQNIKYFTAFALTVAALQHPVLNLTSFRTSSEASKNQVDYNDTAYIYESETSVFSSTSHINFPIEREGDFKLTDDVRHKDLEGLQKQTDIKLEHVDTKIDNLNDNINDVKVLLTRLESKIDELPSKDYVEKLVSQTTNKFLIWTGVGLTTVGAAIWALLDYYSNIIIELISG